jgi:signal transduction histidine kinase
MDAPATDFAAFHARRPLSHSGRALAHLFDVQKRLGTWGLAALTLVTASGLARRSRSRTRRARVARAVAPITARTAGPRESPVRDAAIEATLLADATSLLAADLEYDLTLDRAASLFVSFLADWCLVALVDDEGPLRRVRVAHASRPKRVLAARLEEIEREARRPFLVELVMDTRRPLIVTHVKNTWVARHASGPEQLDALEQLGTASLLVMPLIARGECLGAVVLASDDPRRVFTEASLPRVQDLVGRAATALANARLYERARHAIQARDEILAVVAHDLRTPLHVIEFAAHRLRQNVPGPGRRSTDRSLDWILSSAQRATTLVRDLLDRAKLEWHTLALERVEVDPVDLVRDVARRSEPLGALASVQVRVVAVPPVPRVAANRERLAQAIENLMGNAMKFTPAGGTVTVGVERSGGDVRFFVSDTGAGIEPADLERIFERFWQARNADSRGAGLGLSICKRIVEAHGGHVWVESRVGEGTTVSFTIAAIS